MYARNVAIIAALASMPVSAVAQVCPLQMVPEATLPAVLKGHHVRQSAGIIAFRSKMARDEDGMPTAYHVGYDDGRLDEGADHICVGGDVLELVKGGLVNKYAKGGSVGDLKKAHAKQCKMDYLAIKKAQFPACGPGHLCMRWYGVKVEPRSCGYDRVKDEGCGVPIRQADANGKPSNFYLTTNTLTRPGAKDASRVQSDYADAGQVPFIVMPGKLKLPGTADWRAGDYAIVFANGKTSFAVVGDSGPTTKIGEGSRALLQDLGQGSFDEGEVYTVLLPGSSNYESLKWPLDRAIIAQQAKAILAKRAGMNAEKAMATIRACSSL